jgi:hypothetical protein
MGAAGIGSDFLLAAVHGFKNEICSVRDELGVNTENRTKSAFTLRRGEVMRLKRAHGQVDQRMESGDVCWGCEANVK